MTNTGMVVLEIIMISTAIVSIGFAMKMARLFYFADSREAVKNDEKDAQKLLASPKLG